MTAILFMIIQHLNVAFVIIVIYIYFFLIYNVPYVIIVILL